MRLLKYVLPIWLAAGWFPQIAHGQGFGKNKVQYFSQNWSYIQSEHFDVFFYQDGFTIAEFVADAAEEAYAEISRSFKYTLRDRVTIITYKSHNDFQGTNVTFESPEEGVGGFTEFFKNRVVIPYEGSYEQLRHVVHHELTHAVMLEMIYGGGLGSILASLSRMPMPLWFSEGLAEFESRHGWDTESDLFMRDATINGYVPDIGDLYGFMAYKGGQSVLYYISQRYGQEKISELLAKIKTARDVERGFKLALGLDTEELTKRWHQWLKRTYWPTVADLQDPEDVGRRLTDHRKKNNFVNNSPALSPRGDVLAFLTDRSDYFDIYLLSVVDGKLKKKLLSGQTSAKFEELHWLRPGLSWSPDGKRLVFAAKAGKSDALHILDVEKGGVIRTMRFDLDGVFSPSYSPDGARIAFVGLKNGHSDIYVVNLADESLSKITDDIFSDLDPSWSPDGRFLAFTSDRQDHLEPPLDGENFRMADFDYHETDVYIADLETKALRRLTHTVYNEHTPEWTPREGIISYVANRDGVYNLYLHNLESGEFYAITNLLTGCFQPTWSEDGAVAFSSFFDAGYDIFYLRDPFNDALRRQPAEAAPKSLQSAREPLLATAPDTAEHLGLQETAGKSNLGRIIFDNRYRAQEETESVFLDSSDYLTDAGRYKVNKYKVAFSPDIVYASAAYSTFFGLQAMGLVLFSDVLGDHQIFLGLDVYSDLENSNAQFIYMHLPNRLDYGLGLRQNVYFFYIYDPSTGLYDYFRDRYVAASFYAEYPFSHFTRLEGNLELTGINRETYDPLTDRYHYDQKRRLAVPSLAYVYDTILWGSTGPINGMRARLSLSDSPNLENYLHLPGSDGWGLDFQALVLDARRYFKLGDGYSLALRGTGGFSEGGNPVNFFVGGESNWINRRYQGEIEGSIEDIYFSSFITPFRGGDYYAAQGTRFALANAEFRYPLIRHLVLGWPLPIHFRDIRGALFTDSGTAWDKDHYRGVAKTANGDVTLQDLMLGYGLGARVNLGIFLLRWDVAWRTYLNHTDKPRYYFSLGAEF